MNDDKDFKSVLLPIIRRVMPKLIAEEIVGVQPMVDERLLLRLEVEKIELEKINKKKN